MGRLNRRQFLQKGSFAVAAAGVASAVPGVAGLLSEDLTALGPETSAGMETAVPSMSEPVVARVTDVSTGEIQMFFGTSSSTVNDPQLATSLVRAAR
jgi:hypothetical protein